MLFRATLSRWMLKSCATASFGALIVLASLPSPAQGQSGPPPETVPKLTLDRLYSLPNLIGTSPKGFAWSADGDHVAFLWNDEGRNLHDVRVPPPPSPTSSPLQKPRCGLRVTGA